MKHILINYSVKEERTTENIILIERFFKQLANEPIRGVSHEVYRISRTSFIHICGYSNARICDRETSLPTFKFFLNNLEDIVDQEPIINEVHKIGSYAK